jgi:glycosyltransferase involved in cell wall biosynthesis
MPDVSVVIPTRDRAGLLAQTLATVLWQRNVSLEVVVVDDGSEEPIVGRVTELSDPRVVVVRNETSLGVSGARNAGIERATGDWVAFCDDDDLWAPDKLADQIAAATSEGCSWVYAGDVNIDDRLRIIGGGPPPPPETVMADLVRYNAVPMFSPKSECSMRTSNGSRTGTCGSGLHEPGRPPRYSGRWWATGFIPEMHRRRRRRSSPSRGYLRKGTAWFSTSPSPTAARRGPVCEGAAAAPHCATICRRHAPGI